MEEICCYKVEAGCAACRVWEGITGLCGSFVRTVRQANAAMDGAGRKKSSWFLLAGPWLGLAGLGCYKSFDTLAQAAGAWLLWVGNDR